MKWEGGSRTVVTGMGTGDHKGRPYVGLSWGKERVYEGEILRRGASSE